VNNFLTGKPQPFEVAKDRVLLHSAVIEIYDASAKAFKIPQCRKQWVTDFVFVLRWLEQLE